MSEVPIQEYIANYSHLNMSFDNLVKLFEVTEYDIQPEQAADEVVILMSPVILQQPGYSCRDVGSDGSSYFKLPWKFAATHGPRMVSIKLFVYGLPSFNSLQLNLPVFH